MRISSPEATFEEKGIKSARAAALLAVLTNKLCKLVDKKYPYLSTPKVVVERVLIEN